MSLVICAVSALRIEIIFVDTNMIGAERSVPRTILVATCEEIIFTKSLYMDIKGERKHIPYAKEVDIYFFHHKHELQ